MLKKIAAFAISLTLVCTALTACGKADSSSSSTDSASVESADSTDSTESTDDSSTPDPSLTIDGETVDTSELVMMTVAGHDVSFDLFRYYYYYVLQNYGLTADTVTEDLFPDLLTATVNQIKQEFVTLELAEENDLALDDDDNSTIDSNIDTVKANYEDEDTYLQGLKDYYLTEDVYHYMLELSSLYSKVESTLFENEGKYATTKAEFREIVQDNDEYVRAIHILIPYASQAELDDSTADSYDDLSLSDKMTAKNTAYSALDEDAQEEVKAASKKVAEEVLAKAQECTTQEEFRELIDEYGWDPGMESDVYKEGYYFNPDSSFVTEFKDAAFEMAENEISSELVESDSYGWFIIMRLPVDMDYVEDNIDDLIAEYDSPKIQELYTERMDAMEVTYSDEYNNMTYQSIT